MSYPLKKEYSAALILALLLHAGVVMGVDKPPKGNAPRDGYRLEFSLGAYGGASRVANQQNVEQIKQQTKEQPNTQVKVPEKIVENEIKTPIEKPIVAQKAIEADFTLKKKVKEKVEKKPIKKQPTVVKKIYKPQSKPKLVQKNKRPQLALTQTQTQTKNLKSVDVAKKASRIAGAKAFGNQQTLGAGGLNKSVTTGVSGGVRGLQIDYMTRLQKYLARYKKYPRRARMRRQEGVSVVEFTLSPAGSIKAAGLKQSSGYRLLDKEALAMLKRALPLPQPPQGLIQNSIKIILPISFSLRTS